MGLEELGAATSQVLHMACLEEKTLDCGPETATQS